MHADAWSFYHPSRVFSGIERLEECIRIHASVKGKVLVITTKGALKRGCLNEVKDHVPDEMLYVFEQVQPNPELDNLDKTIHELRKVRASFIIAIGGGSVLDTAKILSVTLPGSKDTPLHRHFRNKEQLQLDRKISLTAIPTTSGSGAEVTPFATVWDTSAYKKYSLNHELLYPEYVLLKPEFCKSLPRKQTLYSGLDLISHALESLWNINSNPITRSFAFQALNLANKSFSKALDSPEDIAGRKGMLHASLLAGMAISQTKTAIAHSISYPLTARFNIPHGLACSFTLPELIRSNMHMFTDQGYFQTVQITLDLLEMFSLAQEVSEYAEKKEILSMTREMIHPERAGNYTGTANVTEVSRILEKSLG